MKSIIKKIGVFAVSACIVLTAAFSAACKNNDNNPAEVGYSVTVLYPNGTPVKASDSGPYARGDVSVTLQDDDGNDITSYENGILDEYGTAHTDYKVPGEYKIAVHYIPEGYDFTADVRTNAEEARYTVSLESKILDYSINVKMPDGSAYANASLKIMKGTTQVKTLTTDAQGNASTGDIAADNYSVVIDGLSKDYGYKPAVTSKTSPTLNVKLFDVHKIEFKNEDVASDEEFESWVAERNFGDHTPINTSVDNYLYEADVADGTECFFRICAPWTGRYSIHCRSEKDENGKKLENANYTFLFYRDNFGTPDETWTLPGDRNSGNNSQFLDLNEGDEYIVSVKSNNGEPYKMSFLTSFDRIPFEVTTSMEGEFELEYDEINYALIKFSPTKSGKYTVTSLSGEYGPELIALSAASLKPLPGDYYSDTFGYNVMGACRNGENGNFTFEDDIQETGVGGTFVYRITLKDEVTYPAKLKIKIERTGDATPEVKYEDVKVQPSVALTQQTAPGGSWHWLDTNGVEPAEENGEWFVTVNNEKKRVYVAITKNLDGSNSYIDYSFATIEYMGENGSGPSEEGSGDNNEEGGGLQETQQNSYLTVTVESELKKYNYTDFIKSYSGYCTGDGCYALNSELKTFLERYTAVRWTDLVTDPNTKPQHPWLLACGYYA